MAIVKVIPVKTRLSKAIDYIKNKDKTEENLLVTGLNCIPAIAFEQFQVTKEYYDKTNRILAFHLIQSFKPGEVDKNTAHEIGIKLADKVTGGNYEVVVSTHIDKGHLHNHIIFNSVSFVDGKKYNACKDSYNQTRNISDELCRRYNLSVINTKSKGKTYKEWYEDKNGTSWKTMMKNDIDLAIKESSNFKEFKAMMQAMNYEIGEGKHLKFRYKGYARFVRGKTLGSDYTKDSIMARIELKNIGLNIISLGKSNRRYFKKKYTRYKKYYRPKNYLEFNINLGIKLLKTLLLKQDQEKVQRPKYLIKYDESVIDKLASQISYINRNHITSRQMLVNLIDQNEDAIANLQALIRSAEKKVREHTELIKTINIYQSSQNNIINLINKADFNNPKFIKKLNTKYKNNPDVNSYFAAKEKLNAQQINCESAITAKLNEHNEYLKRQELLKSRYKELKKEAIELNELHNTVCKIQNREYPFNYGIKREQQTKRQEIDRSLER